MKQGSPVFRTIAPDYGGCDHCELAYQPGDLIGRYRGRFLCEPCADHKAGELLFYGSDLCPAFPLTAEEE